ncbi:hypothetical protein MSIBF_A320005 [groundwater metagenome]|uniref:Glycosyltransferase 2-like domain-containing protein n=1 Tax=groundwater metagenome TaxID=717931 RepID=A0A098EAR5_9ZZZZ
MENKQQKVSIGMPVWNGGDFIKQTLDSLLAQDFTDFELIISDNTSTDKTKEICKEYAERDNRIKYYRNDVNIGAEANFKKVLDLANAPYFMWASYDDLWEPTYISEMVKVLDTNKSVVVAFCVSDSIDANGKQLWVHKDHLNLFSKGTTFKRSFKFLIKSPWYHQANIIYGLMRTSVIKNIGGMINFEKFRENRLNRGGYAVDLLTIFRLIFEGDFYIINKVLFHHRLMRKDTDNYLKSNKKIEIISIFFSKVFNMFRNVHTYSNGLRRIIYESDLKSYQKYFLFCVTFVQEFKMFIGHLFYYFISFLKFMFSKVYRKEYYINLSSNSNFKEKKV